MKFLAVIPARYASSRFPGKPLAKIGGKEMIVMVCQRVKDTGIDCVVATDDKRIYDTVIDNGFEAVMTSSDCGSGTERVEEACRILKTDADVIINVQGDEPFIRREQIEAVKSIFEADTATQIGTLVRQFDKSKGFPALEDPNLVKVVRDDNHYALYFSRSVIPFMRNIKCEEWPVKCDYLTHIGIYAYRYDVLKEIVNLEPSALEKAESLEQLRWLQNGYKIRTALTEFETIGIDTPEDLKAAEEYLLTTESF